MWELALCPPLIFPVVTILLPGILALLISGHFLLRYVRKQYNLLQEEYKYQQQSAQLKQLLDLLKTKTKTQRWEDTTNPMIGNRLSEMFKQSGVAFEDLTTCYQRLKAVPDLKQLEKRWDKQYPAWAGFFTSNKKPEFLRKQAEKHLAGVLLSYFFQNEEKQSRAWEDLCPIIAAYCVPDFDSQVAPRPLSPFSAWLV